MPGRRQAQGCLRALRSRCLIHAARAGVARGGHREDDGTEPGLPALGIALNASCYAMWQPKAAPGGPPKEPDKKDCRRWVQHALREIEVEVSHELDERYADLRQALAIIAGDAVDHGVLLA